MTLAQRIAAELPYLRRHARALAGSQDRGDAAVRDALSAVLGGEQQIDANKPLRLEMFRIFHAVTDQHGLASPHGLETLDRTSQIVMLLSAVEDFSETDCAAIIGLSERETRQLLDDAHRFVQERLRSRVLVIEDEGVIALHIRSIMTDAGHSVVGVARTHVEAVALAEHERPELVLADINLADGSNGIDAVRDIMASLEPTVVFVTAYPERLLTGETIEPAFLVSKPFEPMMLLATVAQALMTRPAVAPSLH